jgi:3',5'-cyclic-AMP phosphodiesterase
MRGVRPRGTAMIAAVAIEPAGGPCIVDQGPPKNDAARKAAREQTAEARAPTEIEGVVRQVLHGPKGEVRGVLLEDGHSGRFPPSVADRLAPLLQVGTRLLLRGESRSGAHATVVAVREIGTSPDDLRRSIMPAEGAVLSWVHFGDLHLTAAGEQNHRDFLALIDIANRHLAARVNFAVLPGDNAENGTATQLRLVRAAIDRLQIPLHILPGDHDYQPRSLEAFHAVLGIDPLPKALVAAGHRCLFLDIVSAGAGGADFRLHDAQLDWLQRELKDADHAGQRSVIFMHAYPADLRFGAEKLTALLARHRVACVDMGHTHYNELANDGHTIFAATRSTGQIEEGPVGFAVAAVDGGVVSWRFQPLTGPWPLVLITNPADHRLITDPAALGQVVAYELRIQAKIWSSADVRRATCQINDSTPIPLVPAPEDNTRWRVRDNVRHLADGLHRLTVRAEDGTGSVGEETITILVNRTQHYQPPPRHADGSDKDTVGAWPEKGIFGSQLGPNRNGRKW